jgi:hypothetical protein
MSLIIVQGTYSKLLNESDPVGTVRHVGGIDWVLTEYTSGQTGHHKWVSKDCAAEITLRHPSSLSSPGGCPYRSSFGAWARSAPTFEDAVRYAISRHNHALYEARQLLQNYKDL